MLIGEQAFQAPWVEKYRPDTLEDVVGNTVAIEQLKSIVKFGNMPNLILVVSKASLLLRDLPEPAKLQASCVWRARCSEKQ